MSRLLPDDSPKTIALACGLGAASSSCSYATVAIARSIFRKGANFTAAMAFEIASTNLVIELGIILTVLMGWQFTLVEFTLVEYIGVGHHDSELNLTLGLKNHPRAGVEYSQSEM